MHFDYETYLEQCFSRHIPDFLFLAVFCIGLGRILYAVVTRRSSSKARRCW